MEEVKIEQQIEKSQQQTQQQVVTAQSPTHSSKKKQLLLILVIIIIIGVVGLFGIQRYFSNQQPSQPENKLYHGKITIGYISFWPGYLGLFLARDKGYFKEEGLNVELKKYDGGTPLEEDNIAGHLQGRGNLTLDTIDETYKGVNEKIVLVIDYSNGADGIISSPSVKTFQDVRGKKFAFEKGSLEEFFTRYALQQNNLSISDITPVNLDPDSAAKALAKGDVDVATTFEPTLSQVVDQIHGNRLYTSANAPGVITDVLTFRNDFTMKYPDTVQAFMRAYFKGIQFWKENPSEADSLIGKELGVSAKDADTALQGITVLTLPDNATAFTYAAGFQSIYGSMRQVNSFVQSQKATSSAQIDTDSLIEPKFVKGLMNQ